MTNPGLPELVAHQRTRIAQLAAAEALVNAPAVRNLVYIAEETLKGADTAIALGDYETACYCIGFAQGAAGLIVGFVSPPGESIIARWKLPTGGRQS